MLTVFEVLKSFWYEKCSWENYYVAPSKVEGAGVPLNGEERVFKATVGGR